MQKEPRAVMKNLRKNKTGGFILKDSKIYYKIIIVEMSFILVQTWTKDWNRTGSRKGPWPQNL